MSEVVLTVASGNKYTICDCEYNGVDYIGTIGEASKCNGDVRDDYIGTLLAESRALHVLANKLAKRANGLVKHKDDMKAQRKKQLSKSKAKENIQKDWGAL